MARTPCWPIVAGDFQRPARSTPYEDNRRRPQETYPELAEIISPWISRSELPHHPYPNEHSQPPLDRLPRQFDDFSFEHQSFTTSHSSTNPFSVGFEDTGLGQVPASSYTYYVANYTDDTPIPNRHPVQDMTDFHTMTIDNVQSAYPGRVTVPNALNAYTSRTNTGMNPVASELSRGIPMPPAQREGHWDEEEQRNFLRGLNECGWSRWKLIADKYVMTRNEYQICSHAQKYRSHFNGSSSSGKTPRKKRRSIHDTTLEDESGKALPLPVPPCDKGDGPAMQPPPPPPGRGGNTDPASILPEMMSEENDETQSSESFDIRDYILDSPVPPGDSPAMQPRPPPLPEDSHGRMPLPLDQPPPPPGRGGDTDPASILPELMSEENDETQSSESFDIRYYVLDSPVPPGDSPAMQPRPLPLPEDSHGRMPLPLDQPPPPPGRGGDTDLASILHALKSDYFEIWTLLVNHLGQ